MYAPYALVALGGAATAAMHRRTIHDTTPRLSQVHITIRSDSIIILVDTLCSSFLSRRPQKRFVVNIITLYMLRRVGRLHGENPKEHGVRATGVPRDFK